MVADDRSPRADLRTELRAARGLCGLDGAVLTWWPDDHTVTGDPETVVLEPYLGGRIYERAQTALNTRGVR